jgi:undecaprenyl-diphosphatase
MSDIISSIILGIIEGLTEFLPISSTGHLILAEQFIGKEGSFANTAFTEAFDIIIQLGAILSVVFYFWKKLFPFSSHKSLAEKRETYALWMKSIIGVIPALILGVLLNDFIKAKLFNPTVVAIALIVWGLVLILVEQRVRRAKVSNLSMLTVQMALMIGLIQCLAMVHGFRHRVLRLVCGCVHGYCGIYSLYFSKRFPLVRLLSHCTGNYCVGLFRAYSALAL